MLGSLAFPGSVSHHSFSVSFFLFVPPCSLFLSSSLLPLFPSCSVFALFLLFMSDLVSLLGPVILVASFELILAFSFC